MRKGTALILTIAFVLFLYGCASWSKGQKGAAIGGGTGAVLGGVIGKAAGSTVVGAILGAAIGGAAGLYIGNYMDKQAEELDKELESAKIERVGEGIKISFDSGLLFDVDKAFVKPESKAELDDLAEILNKYPDTKILIEGHTDSTGSEEHNLTLSRLRSQAVSNYLAQIQIDPTRFTIMGYGESQPVADNSTVEGRALNRRVDLGIMANDKLKKAAKDKGEADYQIIP